jgi:hypothetical protein
MTHVGLIEALPRPYGFVQFQYRLSSYVLLSLSGAMVAVLSYFSTQIDPASRKLQLAVVPLLIVAAVGAAEQVANYPNKVPDRNVVFSSGGQVPPTFYSLNDYYDVSLPVVPIQPAVLFFPPPAIHHDRIVLPYPPSLAGMLVQTNVLGAPYLVGFHGATVVGRAPNGPMVLRLPVHRSGVATVTLSRSRRLPIILGSAISIAGLVGVLGTLLWSATGELALRRKPRRAEA